MTCEIFEVTQGEFLISNDPAKLQLDAIYDLIANRSYWGKGRPREIMDRAVENSLCYGVYHHGQQVGFARVVTDYATFAWLCDVYVDETFRGHGLGKALVQAVVSHPHLKDIRRLLLATRDAHGLYAGYGGFEALKNPERWMERLKLA